MTDIDTRKALINGLHDLADFFETNPDVPVPQYGITASYFPYRGPDEEITGEVDRIAALLGSSIDPESLPHGHYKTHISFGPVTYEAVAILAARRARHDAAASYYGCVTPYDTDAA
ncbi:hypothetical protein HNP84_003922 [Thermocatellispora tengchongensis]|uniref:Uncharacterized protein n=1 Tax=Thermocatellispora tengchongensis TaxID=1073253 RepID=A0A840P6I7_9ACTN|nr:hypothetical protein [Thermocatellispora tengchongensis]MBB5134196.1 hypothetical protein [Thermocatellispora tengchongensis]